MSTQDVDCALAFDKNNLKYQTKIYDTQKSLIVAFLVAFCGGSQKTIISERRGDMSATEPTWGVVATVDEPAVLVAAFVRHHLAIGASEVHLFLDRPHPGLAPLIEGLKGCFVTLCDAQYWEKSSIGFRPEYHIRRQKHNANIAFHHTQCDWLLHCDADEFVDNGDRIKASLALFHDAQQDAVIPYLGIKLRNNERVWCPDAKPNTSSDSSWGQTTVFDGGFRFSTTLYDDVIREKFKPFGMYLKHGLSGHCSGKTMSPVGADLELGIHRAFKTGTHDPVNRTSSTAILHHFDGLTPLHYILKMLKRGYETPNGPRSRQAPHRSGTPPRKGSHRRMDQALFIRKNASDGAKMKRFVRMVKSVNAAQIERYNALLAFDTTPFDLRGCAELDLSAASFDAALLAENMEFFEMAGLAYWGD